MKKMKWFLVAAIFAVCVYTVPAFCEDEGLGEWVSEAAPKGESKLIPPGQFAAMAKYAEEFLTPVPGDSNRPGGHRALYAAALIDGIDDPNLADELNDFFVVDVRTPKEYCAGTVPTAVNIPMDQMFKAENLQQLPLDKPILLVCNSGHTESVVNGILGAMGYNAWSLRFGMIGWKAKSSVAFASSSKKVAVDNSPYGLPAYMPPCQ